MKRVNCVIADDEMLSLDVLEDYISKLDGYRLIARCRNGIEVFQLLKTQSVDLLFLDIQMPQLTGIELVKSLKTVPPLIFTTAFREYALEGYEHNAIDYLLKPISFDRFLRAIDKFERNSAGSSNAIPASREPEPGLLNPFIYVKSSKKTVKVFLKDIVVLEGAKDFVRIKTSYGEIETYQSLQELEQRLPDSSFLRIHRSIIVSVDRIRSYNATHIQLEDSELPIGHSYQRSVREFLKG